MKKILFITFLLMGSLGCYLMAQSQVSSANIVGYNKIQIPPAGGYVQVGLQFEPFNPTLEGILGTNQLISHTKVGNCDRVYVWDTGKVPEPGYRKYAVKSTDMKFHDCDDWSGDSVNPTVSIGSAFWIQSYTGTVATREFAICGEVIAVTNQYMNMVTGYQMIAYPFSCNQSLQDMNLIPSGATSNSKAAKADQVLVWTTNAGGSYKSYALKDDGYWHDADNWGGDPTNPVINLGQGFWYYSRKNSWQWTETNIYLSVFQ